MTDQAGGGIVSLTTDTCLTAIVFGPPMTYGSKRAFVVQPKDGGRPRAVLANVNHASLKAWQNELRERMLAVAPAEPITDAVQVVVTFFIDRPQVHFRVRDGRITSDLKANAAPYPTRRPDGDKVARAAWDCMTGIWVRDDAQVADAIIRKRWVEPWRGKGEIERTVVDLRMLA